MNKVSIEKNSDGTYNVTLPGGGQGNALPPEGVLKRLKNAEKELLAAVEDIRARCKQFEEMIVKP